MAKKIYLLCEKTGSRTQVLSTADLNPVGLIRKLEERGYKVSRCRKPPTLKTLEKWSDDGIASATDGCRVEPDGTCQHGHQSWMLVMGVI